MTLRFHIDCIPPKSTAQGSATIMHRKDGSAFIGKMQSSKARTTQRDLIALFQPHRPRQPYAGPVRVVIDWVYPWRKSESKRNRAAGYRPCDTRPDCDNLCKLVLDIMTRLGFWNDDGQVYSLSIEKGWGDIPGIGVSVVPYKKEEE